MATNELRDISEKMENAFEHLKETVEDQEQKLSKLSEANAEEKMDKIHEDLDTYEKQWTEKFEGLEAKLSAPEPAVAALNADEEEAVAVKQAFDTYLRKGIEAIDPALREKALTASNDTTGGYLAPAEFVQDMIKGIVEFSPIREVANVRSTSARTTKFPTREGTFAAQWIGETGTRSETTGLTFGLIEVPNHELYALVDVSNQDLEDSVFDLDSMLRSEFAEQFGKAEGAAFVDGNGVSKPDGIVNVSGSTTVATTGSGSPKAILPDDIIDTVYALQEYYTSSSRWLLNRTTIKQIRKLKDSNDQYFWQPTFGNGLVDGNPATIMGYGYRECVDMTAGGAGSASDVVGLFGDFRRSYGISDRLSLAIVRDDLTQAASGNVRFLARRRVGGQGLLGEAMVKLING